MRNITGGRIRDGLLSIGLTQDGRRTWATAACIGISTRRRLCVDTKRRMGIGSLRFTVWFILDGSPYGRPFRFLR